MSSGERVKKSSKVKDAATGVEVAIPAPPKKLSSWTTFFRLRNNDVARANPQLAQKGVMELLGTMWKDADLPSRPRSALSEFKRKQKEWDAGRDEREFERMQAAKALGLALSTSWEDLVDAARRAQRRRRRRRAEKRRGPRGSPAKKKSSSPAPPRAGADGVVLNGLDAIFAMATEEKNFEHFGNDMVQCFFDVATVTGDPVRSRALMYVEQLAQRWRHGVVARGWRHSATLRPSPQNILETVVGIYCMERVGVSSHKLKEDVKRPYYAERASVDIGCAYAEVLAHLRTLRPYRGPADLPWDAYVDQCYLDQATHRWDVDMDAYTSYHATMVASQALLAHSRRRRRRSGLEDAAAAAPEKKKKAAAPSRWPSPAPREGRPAAADAAPPPPPKAPSTPKAPPMPAGDVEASTASSRPPRRPDHGAAIRLVKRLNDSTSPSAS
ncbi:amino acid transmembrane transporter [Aureococcus anophagefferens]|nr:amino acid transmembrane transporter [Aureococcus anophagefferens]